MVKEAFRNGWQKFKENWKLLVVVQFASIAISAVFNLVTDNVPSDFWYVSLVVYLVTVVLGVVMGIGMIKVYLKVFDGQPASLKDLFLHYKLFLKFILAQIVAGLVGAVAVAPFILTILFIFATDTIRVQNALFGFFDGILIIASVLFIFYIGMRLMFVQYLVVDKELGPVAAVKGSFAITKGHVMSLLGFGVMSFLVAILGVLALVVGLFAAIPVISLATVYVYRKISA